jgi:hypothetical protein
VQAVSSEVSEEPDSYRDGSRVRPSSARRRGVQRGQRNVGVVSLYRIAEALGMSLSELLPEVQNSK